MGSGPNKPNPEIETVAAAQRNPPGIRIAARCTALTCGPYGAAMKPTGKQFGRDVVAEEGLEPPTRGL